MGNGKQKKGVAQTNPAPPGTLPAGVTTIDEAISPNVALLYSPAAPLASNSDPNKKEDRRAVWARVPDTFDPDKPTLLIYLHGFNGYVTVSVANPNGVHRSPPFGWINGFRNDGRFGNVDGTLASGPKYKMDQVFQKHSPLVLVPEVGVADGTAQAVVDPIITLWETFLAQKKAFDAAKKARVVPLPPEPTRPSSDVPPWAKNGIGQMSTADGLGNLIDNCIVRLQKLPKPLRTPNYLDPAKPLDQSKLKRLFLSGHSGGGQPLAVAAASNLALGGAVPIDLWSYDSTYGTGKTEFPDFCQTLDRKGKLGNGPGLSRFVSIVIKDSATDVKRGSPDRMTDIAKDINSRSLKAGSVTEVDYNHNNVATELPRLETILSTKPMVLIRITNGSVVHDMIPTVFTPILVRTSASL